MFELSTSFLVGKLVFCQQQSVWAEYAENHGFVQLGDFKAITSRERSGQLPEIMYGRVADTSKPHFVQHVGKLYTLS